MHIASNSASQCGRKQTDRGDRGRHQHGPQALGSPKNDSVLQIFVFMALMVEARDHDDAILHRDSKERDESDGARYIQRHAAERQCNQPAQQRHGNNCQESTRRGAECRTRNRAIRKSAPARRHDKRQPLLGALLVLELPAPFDLIFGGVKFHCRGDFPSGFCQKARQVPASQIEPNSKVPAIHLASDAAFAGRGLISRHLRERNTRAARQE